MDLFLIGKTGNGKSETGNTILGQPTFTSSDFAHSATLNTAVGWFERNGEKIGVVDGPSMIDTWQGTKVQKLEAEKKLSEGFVHCPNGFNALLLVFKYGIRFTDEEVKTIDILRAMFGPSFLKDHAILIFTHGENFDLRRKQNPEKTFDSWLREQTGELGNLIKECENRAVLFYNLSEEKRDQTLDLLFTFVNRMGKRYTGEMFDKVKEERDRFIKAFGAIQLKDHIQSDLSLLNAMLQPIAGTPDKRVLDPLLRRLEESLQKENGKLQVVKSLKLGIWEARNGNYEKANKTFLRIEGEGKGFLVKLADGVMKVIRHLSRSCRRFGNYTTLYESVTCNLS